MNLSKYLLVLMMSLSFMAPVMAVELNISPSAAETSEEPSDGPCVPDPERPEHCPP